MNTVEGGCHCGNIRYKIKSENKEGYYCHCRMCQLSFGNIFASFLNIKKSEIEWLKSDPTYFLSSKFAKRGFCNLCGTPLTFEFNDSDNMDISVGSLDEPNRIKPTSHFAIESKVDKWFIPDGLPQTDSREHAKLQEYWHKYYGDQEQSLETIKRNQ